MHLQRRRPAQGDEVAAGVEIDEIVTIADETDVEAGAEAEVVRETAEEIVTIVDITIVAVDPEAGAGVANVIADETDIEATETDTDTKIDTTTITTTIATEAIMTIRLMEEDRG